LTNWVDLEKEIVKFIKGEELGREKKSENAPRTFDAKSFEKNCTKKQR
jgi:hypothetical protein